MTLKMQELSFPTSSHCQDEALVWMKRVMSCDGNISPQKVKMVAKRFMFGGGFWQNDVMVIVSHPITYLDT